MDYLKALWGTRRGKIGILFVVAVAVAAGGHQLNLW